MQDTAVIRDFLAAHPAAVRVAGPCRCAGSTSAIGCDMWSWPCNHYVYVCNNHHQVHRCGKQCTHLELGVCSVTGFPIAWPSEEPVTAVEEDDLAYETLVAYHRWCGLRHSLVTRPEPCNEYCKSWWHFTAPDGRPAHVCETHVRVHICNHETGCSLAVAVDEQPEMMRCPASNVVGVSMPQAEAPKPQSRRRRRVERAPAQIDSADLLTIAYGTASAMLPHESPKRIQTWADFMCQFATLVFGDSIHTRSRQGLTKHFANILITCAGDGLHGVLPALPYLADRLVTRKLEVTSGVPGRRTARKRTWFSREASATPALRELMDLVPAVRPQLAALKEACVLSTVA